MHHVALQRHQTELMSALPHDRNPMIQVVRHNCPPEQVFHDLPVFIVTPDQVGCDTQAAGHIQRFLLQRSQRPGPDGSHRQESRPPQPVLPQELNHLLCGFLILGHDVLLGISQDHIHRGFVLPRHADQLAQRPAYAADSIVPRVQHNLLYGMRVSFHFPGHFIQKLLPGFHIPHFRQFPVVLFPGLNYRSIRSIQLLPGLPQRIGQAVLRFGFFIQPFLCILCVLFQPSRSVPHLFAPCRYFLQPGVHGPQHGLQSGLVIQCGSPAVHHIHHRGFLLFKHSVFLSFLRAGFFFCLPCLFQQRLLFRQGFGPFSAAVTGLRRQPFHLIHPLLRGTDFLRDPLTVLVARTAALLQGTHGILGFMHGLHAVHHGGMRSGNLLIQLCDLILAPVAFFTFFMKGNFRLVQHRADSLQVPVCLLQPGFHPVAPDQEQVQVQHLQFSSLVKVYAGILRLLLQRGKLALQFIQDVVHPVHILQRMGQFLVRLFLARLELDDTRRLFKNQAPVLALPGKYLVNPPLADNGIAFLTDAGIPEEIHHILQPAGRAVQVIFAVAVAVNTAGHHHFRIVQRKRPILVIKDQRDLAVSQRLALLRPAEDHILHAGAAERLCALLTQHPADRVGNIAFSGTIRSDNARNALVENDLRSLGKGLKAVQFQSLQSHSSSRSIPGISLRI